MHQLWKAAEKALRLRALAHARRADEYDTGSLSHAHCWLRDCLPEDQRKVYVTNQNAETSKKQDEKCATQNTSNDAANMDRRIARHDILNELESRQERGNARETVRVQRQRN